MFKSAEGNSLFSVWRIKIQVTNIPQVVLGMNTHSAILAGTVQINLKLGIDFRIF